MSPNAQDVLAAIVILTGVSLATYGAFLIHPGICLVVVGLAGIVLGGCMFDDADKRRQRYAKAREARDD